MIAHLTRKMRRNECYSRRRLRRSLCCDAAKKLLVADRVAEISLVSHDNFFPVHTDASRDRRKRSRDHEHRKSPAEITPQVNVVVGKVHHIELAAKRVAISRDSSDYLQQIGYDHLVIALGSVTNFHDLAGVAELPVPMKSLSDAIRFTRSGPAPFGGSKLRM